jgi:hypothetical protein
MSNPTPKTSPDAQRDALKQSEKKSSEQQPRSYDERNETDKVVHINPPDPDSDASIQGIDPKQ